MFKSFANALTKNYGKLAGKLSVITGGSAGIGLATTQKFLENGSDVVVFDVNPDTLAALDDIETYGNKVYGFQVDVSSKKSVDEAFEKVREEIGSVDVLVNNAGITRDAMMYKMSEDDWDKVINVNLKGCFLCGTAVAKQMLKEEKKGVIINTSSVVGIFGNIGQSNYAASKFGVIGLTKVWAKELGRKGIRINCVAPGYTMTAMMNDVPDEILEIMNKKTPLQKLGKPEDIANAFLFLASDDADYITGHVLSVDGGLTL